ncbi:MAG: sel1 repeat family protein [Synergistaceae bacterium]|nr:sel1 repeat family protein [Synergistaceae bacterium]MBQ9403443.1 sel1 repeat family protein [Synergistaceae bacterium]MBQ9594302.1 sel1 repeat family protein [Synergistaceae bacterium]MBR0202759.1 sel1 repeat family protein [Synergistaceae bacterium]
MKKLTVAFLLVVLTAGAALAMSPEQFSCLKEKAIYGDVEAQMKLGYIYEHGVSVAKDDAEAFKWYSKAAGCGHPCAQFFVAVMYNEGRGVEKNDALAAKWLRRAAVRGNREAQYLFGKKVYYGEGLAQNETAGLKWLRAAACGGHAEAKKFLDAHYAAEQAKEKEMQFISSCSQKPAPKFVKAPRKVGKKAVRFAKARRVKAARAKVRAKGPYCW